MKVFISVDMEGISGISGPDDVTPGAAGYERGRWLMIADANAAIEGAFDGGATEVLVNDSHWYMTNLHVEDLDERVRLISGHNKPRSMTNGLDPSFGVAMFVGYHARTGTAGGVLNHTMIGREVQDVRLNGEPAGETRLNAALAGHLGVPVGLVTGDDKVCMEAASFLPGIEAVAVKNGVDKYTANLMQPKIARERIREAAAQAVARAPSLTPFVVPPPVALGVTWNSTTIAAACAMIPGVSLTGPRDTDFPATDAAQALDVLEVMLYIAGSITSEPNTYD